MADTTPATQRSDVDDVDGTTCGVDETVEKTAAIATLRATGMIPNVVDAGSRVIFYAGVAGTWVPRPQGMHLVIGVMIFVAGLLMGLFVAQ
jgi:hypothetical protein